MENLTTIANLLGAENEKKLKDAITDLLIEQISEDLNNMSVYLIDFEELMDEIRDEIKDELETKVRQKYMKIAEEKFSELFDKNKEFN